MHRFVYHNTLQLAAVQQNQARSHGDHYKIKPQQKMAAPWTRQSTRRSKAPQRSNYALSEIFCHSGYNLWHQKVPLDFSHSEQTTTLPKQENVSGSINKSRTQKAVCSNLFARLTQMLQVRTSTINQTRGDIAPTMHLSDLTKKQWGTGPWHITAAYIIKVNFQQKPRTHNYTVTTSKASNSEYYCYWWETASTAKTVTCIRRVTQRWERGWNKSKRSSSYIRETRAKAGVLWLQIRGATTDRERQRERERQRDRGQHLMKSWSQRPAGQHSTKCTTGDTLL